MILRLCWLQQKTESCEYALPQNTDTHHTFELKLDSREFTYKSKPSMEAEQATEGGKTLKKKMTVKTLCDQGRY